MKFLKSYMKIGSDAPAMEDFMELKAGCDQEGVSAELGCGGGRKASSTQQDGTGTLGM